MWRELPIGANSVSIRQSSLRLSRGGKMPNADIWAAAHPHLTA